MEVVDVQLGLTFFRGCAEVPLKGVLDKKRRKEAFK